MPTPFFMRIQRTIDITERLAKQAKMQQDVIKAQRDVDTPLKKKSIFGQAIKMAAGFTPDVVEDVGKAAAGKTWEGIQGWNNQVQSVPAALFTKGTVEDGQYTTKRNLIGNPLSNVKSHVKAQREVGIAPKGGNLLEDIGAGFKSARLAGKAYEEDPDIAQGTKFLTGVTLDPTSYLAAGTLSKLPKVAKVGGAKGKLARGALNVVEGFENPAQVGKFAVGGALGTELASRYSIPGVPEVVEQLGGGLGGGMLGAAFKVKHLEDVDSALAKLQGREGKHAALGLSTEVVEEGERVYHGTPSFIPKGEIMISPKGDMTAGFYLSRDANLASRLAEEGGDTANVTGFPQEFLEERAARVSSEGGNQVYRYKPTKDLLLLRWDERLTADEVSRINNSLAKLGKERVVTTDMDAREAVATIRPSMGGFGGQTPNILGVFSDAGFDGFSQDLGAYPQIVLFQPNKVLEETLTPPTVVKGSAAKKSTTSSPIGQPKKQVEIKKNANGKWEFTHPDGQISEGFSFNELKNWAESYGYEPVYYGADDSVKGMGVENGPFTELLLKGWDKSGKDVPFQKWLTDQGIDPTYAKEIAEAANFTKKAPDTLPGDMEFWGHGLNNDKIATAKIIQEMNPDKYTDDIIDYVKKYVDEDGIVKPDAPSPEDYLAQFKDKVYAKEPKLLHKTEVTPSGKIAAESDLHKPFVYDLKKYGELHEVSGKPIDFSKASKYEYLGDKYWKNVMNALEWADNNQLLTPIGKDQLDAVIKKMDEISLTGKAIQPKKAYVNELYAKDIEHLGYIKDIGQKPVDMSTVNSEPYLKSMHEALTWGADKVKLSLEGAKQLEYLDDKFGKWGTQISQPKVAPAIGKKPNTWSIGGVTLNAKQFLEWSTLSDADKAKYIENLKGKVAPAIKPVDPDEIAGIKSIQSIEDQLAALPPSYEKAEYAAPGQEGAPIAGKPKGKGEVTPIKSGGKWSAAGFVDEDLGDLMDKLTKAGYKVNDPFGGVSGGALPEILITPITPQIGLTKGEKISNALTKVKKFIIDHGVENNEIATPISKEYIRINHVVKTHATLMGKLAQRVEKLTGIRHPEDIIDMDAISDEAKRAVEALQRSEEAFFETQLQMGVKKPLDPTDFWNELKLEEHAKSKRYSDMLNEYGNAVANKVSDEWLKQQIKRLEETIKLSDEAGKPIPTSSVSGISDVKLPKSVGDVLSNAVHKVHPKRDSDWAELYGAVNNQLRGMWAAGDASFIGIQQLPTWADNPLAAAKSMKVGFETLKDPTVIADFILKHDELRYGTGKPTVTEYAAHNLHIAQASGQGTDLGGIGGRVQSIKGYGSFLKKSNTLFTETGNANRIMLADYLWDQYEAGGAAMLTGIPLKGGTKVGAKEGMTRAQILDAIGEAANRATGYSQRGFGGTYGSALFFAPRFMQSQLEMIMKAAYGNQIENQVARRQLTKLAVIGAGLTMAINEFNGESTEFDPRDSNFMRIKNIGGTDISVFGPWDTLIRGVVRAAPTMDADGNVTFGDPMYILRSKLSPVLSSSLDWITGENIIGQPSHKWENVLKNTLLPFSLREFGQEPIISTSIGGLGGKATPLTESEKLDNKLEGLGIKKSDPEYLIKRREYLSEHPEDVPKASTEEFKQSQKIQAEIKARRKANDDLALQSGQTLVEFRDNRKLLLTEQRNRLGEVIKSDNKKLDSKQRKWLNSYFDLFDDESNKDFITGEINPDTFDAAVAKWVNTTGNGTVALDFVNRYMGAGLNTVESTYYNDMRKLDSAGYFDKPRYQNMKSDLTEDEITSLVRAVDSFRVANPDIQSMSWAITARKLLKDSISNEELLDVIHSRLKAYENPEITELKKQYAKETLWFNPRADWNSYTNYAPGRKTSGNSGGKLVKPKLGGALKASLNKPTLK